ncbi:MAG: PHP domain-containing protein [Chloroflexota bacterium]|nr:PHP domain-containing protein [Chloroflexota bacterium]
MAGADLHTHSTRSDGLLAPAELVREARRVGLDYLALTDHDSVAGIAEAEHAASLVNITLIVGVELSVRDASGVEDHLLGLYVDPSAPSLRTYLGRLQADRQAMAERTLSLLCELGVPVSRERVAALAAGAVITRPHIARAMVEAGHVADEREAFARYLGSGGPAAPRRPSPEPAAAIAAIHNAGGVAVLAHPVFSQDREAASRLEGLASRLDAMHSLGLQGLECHYPDATAELTSHLARLAVERGLIVTGGSDYHGPGKAPFVPLGQVTVQEAVIRALRAAKRR